MEVREDNGRRPWLRKSRAAALGFGLGATLALSPFVWAENPAGNAAEARYDDLSDGADAASRASRRWSKKSLRQW